MGYWQLRESAGYQTVSVLFEAACMHGFFLWKMCEASIYKANVMIPYNMRKLIKRKFAVKASVTNFINLPR